VPPADPRLQSQIDLILGTADADGGRNGLEGSAAHPADWREVGDVEYLYRQGSILVHPRDVDRVIAALAEALAPGEGEPPPPGQLPDDVRIARYAVTAGVLRLEFAAVGPRVLPLVPEVLDSLDRQLGPGVARPDTILFVCPNACPATEPEQVPAGTSTPFPRPGDGAGCGCGPHPACDGAGVSVAVVDTGFVAQAALDHPWLTDVTGDEEVTGDPVTGHFRPYAWHGVFVAGGVRAMAPDAAVGVKGAFLTAGANYETEIVPKLAEALAESPDIVVLTFAATTRNNLPLPTFDDLYETHLRHLKGVVVLCPAGNSGSSAMMWPGAYPWTVTVGALSANWRSRAHFSNHGGWVDVYAPGEDLVNAYGDGTFRCEEPPDTGVVRSFTGMARWSGTSYSTPLVAGLVAARMSVTGESGQLAAASLLRLARSQSIAGVGPVLLPGQACCEPRRDPCRRCCC
jgi:Subtilase family